MDLGKRIKERREELGMTQDDLAKKVGYTSRTTVNKIESGANNLRQTKIIQFAKALECSPAWLMGYDPDTKLGKIQELKIEASLEGERDANLLINFHKLSDRDKDVIENMVDTLLRSYD